MYQVSEEEEELIIIDDQYKGQYAVVFDPLDGSSNIECGVSIGSIFGVYHVENEAHSTVADVLQVCVDVDAYLWMGVCGGLCSSCCTS